MKNRDSSTGLEDSGKRLTKRPTGSLEPLPDADRISSVGTVRAVASEPQLRVDHMMPKGGEEAPPVRQRAGPLGRKRAITNVWNGGALDRQTDERDKAPTIGFRYRIVEKVGAGGMSEIYKVRHIHMDKEFALKVIDAKPGLVTRARQLFLREAKTASQLDHPNIVQIIDFGVDEEHGSFIVMEYLKGETLYARLGRVGRLKVHQALQIALQVAEALHHMHGVGIIHCDVKAENVFMYRTTADTRQRMQLKMIDFGLSRPRTQHVKLADVEVGGTPQYMSPELINGESPQPSMDIYALGNLLYEVLTGAVPFSGTLEEIIEQQLHSQPVTPSQRMEEPLESRVEEIIMEMLQKDPADRQSSMGQVIFQLRTVMAMYDFPGARIRGTTTGERPAISKTGARVHQPMVENCPFPMFQLDSSARIVYANDSFCHFVQLPMQKLRGLSVDETRLAVVYPSIETDALSCAKNQPAEPLQRAFSFELKNGKKSSMLCWLTAQVDRAGDVERVNGYIHPIG